MWNPHGPAGCRMSGQVGDCKAPPVPARRPPFHASLPRAAGREREIWIPVARRRGDSARFNNHRRPFVIVPSLLSSASFLTCLCHRPDFNTISPQALTKPPPPQPTSTCVSALPALPAVRPISIPSTTPQTNPRPAKQSWRGCGSHLPTVFANVPEDQWCTCEPKYEVNGKEYPPAAKVNLMPSMAMPSFLKGWVGGGKAEEKEEGKK